MRIIMLLICLGWSIQGFADIKIIVDPASELESGSGFGKTEGGIPYNVDENIVIIKNKTNHTIRPYFWLGYGELYPANGVYNLRPGEERRFTYPADQRNSTSAGAIVRVCKPPVTGDYCEPDQIIGYIQNMYNYPRASEITLWSPTAYYTIASAFGIAFNLYPRTLSDIGIGEPSNSYNIDITLINHGIHDETTMGSGLVSKAEVIFSDRGNNCLDDLNEIQHSIDQFDTVSTHPPYKGRILTVYFNTLHENNDTCTVKCYQVNGYGNGKCTWTRKNWGNTIKFTPA